MKSLLLFILVIVCSSDLLAESRYITDETYVPLRSSPCGRCSILIGGLKTGTSLTFLKEETPEGESQPWSQVKTKSGTVGWMPSQYLESQQVAKYRLKTLQARIDALTAQNSELKNQVQQAESTVNTLTEDIEKLTSAKQSISSELSHVKQISSDSINLLNQNQELLKRNKMLQGEVNVLSASNEKLRSRTSQTWFLYGGILVAISSILAVLLPHLKRRKKFSEWG